MHYKFVYENNRGEKISLNELPYWVNVEPILDYAWSYTTKEKRRGDIIAGFSKKVNTLDLTMHIMASNVNDRDRAIDNFNNVIEADIYDGMAGRIWLNDWYTRGYIVSAKNTKWQYDVPVDKKIITLAREQNNWYRETFRNSYDSEIFHPEIADFIKSYDFEDGGYDYAYDYMTDFESFVDINNPSVFGSDFVLTIQGYADRPEIHIGDTIIQFNEVVDEGCYLVVDSTARTAILTAPDGNKVNFFSARNPEYYIFRRIDAGHNAVTWNGAFKWELQLFEERSEPRWLMD